MSEPRMDTKLVHAGEPVPRHGGAVALPIYQSSTFEGSGGLGYHGMLYARLSNTPSHDALHAKLAALENAESAVVTASGMAAISTAILTVVAAGDHLLIHKMLYGGTYGFVTKDLPALGITYDVIDATDPRDWESMLRPNTRAVYVESIINPLLDIPDHKSITRFARKHGLVSLIDNTFTSPVNFRPLEHGYDLSLHSATKYLNGHTDLIAGAVMGSADLIERIRLKLNHFGGSLDPHACFLLHRGLKTLGLRVRRHNENALTVARFLAQHPAISRVRYPGLDSHPQHQRAKELFDGFGGMMSVELASASAAERFLERTRMALKAPSLGGVETLLSRPAAMSHAALSEEERAKSGISDSLVRISIGIEDPEDIIVDFRSAL